MRTLLLYPVLVAASLAACSKSPTESEQPQDGSPSLAVAEGVCPNTVTYFFQEVGWQDVSTGFVFGHIPPKHSKAKGTQEYSLTLDDAILGSLRASHQGGCSAEIHILSQGYMDASGNSKSHYEAEILVGVNRASGRKHLIARILDAAETPPLPADCNTYPTPDACVHDYDHAVPLFPVLNQAPTVGDALRVKGNIAAEAKVRGQTLWDEAGASYMIYRNGPSMPKLVITLP